MTDWAIIGGIIAAICSLVGILLSSYLKRRTDREGNEILSFKAMSEHIREMDKLLTQCRIDCDNCRKDHNATLVTLGEQQIITKRLESDLTKAFEKIRKLNPEQTRGN